MFRAKQLFRDVAVCAISAGTIAHVIVRRGVSGPKHASWGTRYECTVEVMRTTVRLGHDRMSIELRRKLPILPLPRAITRRLSIHKEEVAGVQAEVHRPRDWQPGGTTYLHYHGGAYAMCSPATHRLMLARIAVSARAQCIAPNYRKAPEHPYPVPLDDGFTVYKHLLESGVDPGSIVLGGDSAGGGMALAVMLRARDEGLPLPRAAVLMSPWVDLTAVSGASIDDNHDYDYLSGAMLRSGVDDYLAGSDPRDPLVSPIFADLSGLPPLLIHSGGAEILLDQNKRLAMRARAAGVDVKHAIADGMVHVFQIMGPIKPAGAAIKSIGRYVRGTARYA